MKNLIVLMFLILAACGNGAVLVDKHTVSRDELKGMCNDPLTCDGHSDWGETPEGQRWCDIYLMPEHEYFSTIHYLTMWGHEARHCEEGEFH